MCDETKQKMQQEVLFNHNRDKWDWKKLIFGNKIEITGSGAQLNSRVRIQKLVVTYDVVSCYRKSVCPDLFATGLDLPNRK
jgi:uncharacterized Rossmann fold enzyme